jgi:hypothetical protein
VTSGCRRIWEFVVDSLYWLLAICVEIVDRFDSKE